VWITVPTALTPDSSEWRITLTEADEGTRITQQFHVLRAPKVLAVLSDVTRVGEWSHECRGAEWLDGATTAAPGVRFRGRNRAGVLVRWARVCVIRAVDPPHEFVWETVGPPLMRDSTLWRVRLHPVEGGTRIRQEFRILSMAAWADRVVAATIPAHRDRTAALAADLRRLGEVSVGGRRTS
jgi:hypothetical protein